MTPPPHLYPDLSCGVPLPQGDCGGLDCVEVYGDPKGYAHLISPGISLPYAHCTVVNTMGYATPLQHLN